MHRWTVFAVTVFCAVTIGFAQTPRDLFTPIIGRDLNEAQSERLSTYTEDPTAGTVNFVEVDLSLAREADALNFNLVPGQQMPMKQSRVDTRELNDYSWFGTDDDTGRSASLVVRGGEMVGTIRDGTKVYRIRPLGDDLHAVIEVDTSAFPPDHPPRYDRLEHGTLPEGADLRDGDCVQTVLVAYTDAAAAEAGNIDALIQLAVDETNTSYANSDIPFRIELLEAMATNYTEAGSIDDDVDSLVDPNDGKLDDVHARRDEIGADMALLVTGNGNFCGLASAILADESTAFAAVRQNCATGYYSFGHEIGHLQGARHNPQADPTTTPFSYGHGFFHQPASWRTVMSYNCGGGCTRIDWWSNPNIQRNGVPMGTAATNHNARVLGETACTIAGFRTHSGGSAPGTAPPTTKPDRVPTFSQVGFALLLLTTLICLTRRKSVAPHA